MVLEYTKIAVFYITVVLGGQVLLKSREFFGVAHRRFSTFERRIKGGNIPRR
jgi:hypothetical protein